MTKDVFTIPADMAFSDVLARVLLKRYRHQPLQLSEVQIFLPTRRAVRNLSRSFLQQSQGKALLLPQFQTLGDLDDEDLARVGEAEMTPALAELSENRAVWHDGHRLLVAMKMLSHMQLNGDSLSHDQQLALARGLLQLLDQSETEGLDLANLKTLVDDRELAEHWQKSLQFLSLLADVWPVLEADWEKISRTRLRRLNAEAQIEIWRSNPPRGPVIVAGTTASIPSTRALLVEIAQLKNSEILLPGLDTRAAASPATWSLIGNDPTHPQFGLHQLCHALTIDAANITVWPAAQAEIRNSDLSDRVALAQWAALPAEATQPKNPTTMGHDGWRTLPLTSEATPPQQHARLQRALSAIELVEAKDQNHEAKIIALILRDCLETPGSTAALVTPNRDLARMVAAQMRRWGLVIDDSAGTPLDKAPAAQLIRAILDLSCDGAPSSSLLDIVKSPLAGSTEPNVIAALERFALRGSQPGSGLKGVQSRLQQALQDLKPDDLTKEQDREALLQAIDFIEKLKHNTAELSGLANNCSLRVLSETLCATAERIVPSERLWAGDAGETLARLFAEFHDDHSIADALSLPTLKVFRTYLSLLLRQETLRLPFGTHPRISILGTLEARLLNVDHVIIGGLNENSFPANGALNPWLSRDMRARFGLPATERKIGLAAHDFIQAMGNRRVSLTRSVKEAGAQTTASRFIRRLESYIKQLDARHQWSLTKILRQPIDEGKKWQQWASELDRPIDRDGRSLALRFAPPLPAKCPTPSPAISRRPRQLSVSEIEAWNANPYAIYAKRILRLRPWEPIETPPDARLRGTLIHNAAEAFVRAKQQPNPASGIGLGNPDTDLAYYMQLIEQEMVRLQLPIDLKALWKSRIENAGRWFIENDNLRRLSNLEHVDVEVEGKLKISLPGPVDDAWITARADRVEYYPHAGLSIVDYKTGTAPTNREVFSGKKPQLSLEALIFAQRPINKQNISIEYWAMGGGSDPGKVRNIIPPSDFEMTLNEALGDIETQLPALLNQRLNTLTPLGATAAGWGDYHHLSRLQEWSKLDNTVREKLTRGADKP